MPFQRFDQAFDALALGPVNQNHAIWSGAAGRKHQMPRQTL